jgi:hypothetical protein
MKFYKILTFIGLISIFGLLATFTNSQLSSFDNYINPFFDIRMENTLSIIFSTLLISVILIATFKLLLDEIKGI